MAVGKIMQDEKIALTALHVASRPENMTIFHILGVDGQASFLELRSGSGLSNEGLRRRLEDLQRYHMIRGVVSPLRDGVRVLYGLTDVGDIFYRLLMESLDRLYVVGAKPASNRFVLDIKALRELVRIVSIKDIKKIFLHSKIILRKADYDKLKKISPNKENTDVKSLLNDTDVISVTPVCSKDETLTEVERHLRKAKKLDADDSDLVVTAMSLEASLITDNVSVQLAARSMGIMSTGSANVSNLRGTRRLQDIFYEVSLGSDASRHDRATSALKSKFLQNTERIAQVQFLDTLSGLPWEKTVVSASSVHADVNRGIALGSAKALQKDLHDVFYSTKERVVYKRLVEKNPISAKKFLGALLTLRKDFLPHADVMEAGQTEGQPDGCNTWQMSNPDKIAQSAHSIREMLNSLLRDEEPSQTKNRLEVICPRCRYKQLLDVQESNLKNYNRERIKRIFDPLDNLPDHFKTIYDELYKMHNWFVRVSHSDGDIFENEYYTKLKHLTDLMHVLLTPYYDSTTQISWIARMRNPQNSDLKKVEKLIRGSTQLYNNFFIHAGSDWLPMLEKDGKYFKYDSSKTAKNEPRSYSALPEFAYLARTAASKPFEVKKIILNIKISKKYYKQNSQVIWHLVSAGIAMPPECAKEVAQKSISEKWYCAKPALHVQKLAELMVHVAKIDIATSLDMCYHLLDVTVESDEQLGMLASRIRYREIQGFVEYHYYEEIIEKYIPQLANMDNDAVLQTICAKLKKSIDIKNKFELDSVELQKQQDSSTIWRPAIEDHGQNRPGIQSLLVGCIRNLLIKSEKLGIENLRASMSIIALYEYPIFRRIEMYIYARNPEYFFDTINKIVVEYFDKSYFKHEYYNMIKTCYVYLTASNKKLLLNSISRGPARSERIANDEEYEEYKMQWRLAKLDPIIEHLPEYKNEYDSLVKKYGRSTMIMFNHYIHHSVRKLDNFSQISDDITPRSMIKFLLTYSKQDSLEELEGLRYKFQNFVKKNPVEYSKLVPKILLCRREFHYDFLAGFSKKHDQNVNWRPVLGFCADVIASKGDYDQAEFEYIIQACANILRVNLTTIAGGIPYSMRKRVWHILEHCINAIPHDTISQETYAYDDELVFNTSINNTAGLVTHALVNYAAWQRSNLDKDSKRNKNFLSKIRSIFDSLLDPDHPQSVSIRVALGYGLASLFYSDPEWTRQNVGVIFIRDEKYTDLGDAAWGSYLLNIIYDDVFYLLRQEYMYRIMHILKNNTHKKSQSLLADNVAVAYLHEIRGSAKVLDVLISHAPADIIEKCLETIGLGILHEDAKNEELDARIDSLLKLKKIKCNPGAGWLFVCGATEKNYSICVLNEILVHTNGMISPIWKVLEELKTYAGSHPFETIQCIQKIIHGNKNSSNMLLIVNYLDVIFEHISCTKNESAIRVMKGTVDFLGRMGIEQFKEFA